jgi:hypothetical protein
LKDRGRVTVVAIGQVIRFLVCSESSSEEIGMRRKVNKILKRVMMFVVVFDILMLLSQYRIIEFGAFCLGMKTSEIVYERTTQVSRK